MILVINNDWAIYAVFYVVKLVYTTILWSAYHTHH